MIRRHWLKLVLPVFQFLISACAALGVVDTSATLQAENAGYVIEATSIAVTLQARQAAVVATVQAESTVIAEGSTINRQLAATIAAGSTPTIAVSVGDRSAVLEGNRSFVPTGISTRIRQSDGCIEGPIANVPSDAPQIYATVHAYNVEGGIEMSVEWYTDGSMVWTDSWTIPRFYEDICIWFNITPNEVVFTPGEWSAQLFADGFPLEGPMRFTIIETMMDDG